VTATLTKSDAPFIDNPLQFCRSQPFMRVIIKLLKKGTESEQNAIFEALLPNFGRLVFRDPEWKIAKEMLSVGTVRQKLEMAQLFTTILRSAEQGGPLMEGLIVPLLRVLPGNVKKLWVERMKKVSESAESRKMREALANIEKIDAWI
jgi:hypothetical protein